MAIDLGMKILIVDSFSTARRIEKNTLRQLGFKNVEEADSGDLALQIVRSSSSPFGLIISDWNMEPMTGYEFLKEVRIDSQLKNIPFIMTLDQANSNDISMAEKAGLNNYIIKPFNAETLKIKLVAVFGRF